MKIWCFGCGFNGREFFEEAKTYEDFSIEGYFDNSSKEGEKFCGLAKLVPTKENCKGKFIVINTEKYYHEISQQLMEMGLTEKKDYVSLGTFFEMRATKLDLPVRKIFYTDFWNGFDIHCNFIACTLRKFYKLIIDNANPDYIFCSVFGRNVLKYKGIRCCFTGENVIPNLNIYDYVIGFDYIHYEDCYLRWPLYRTYTADFQDAMKKHENIHIDNFMKRDFCCRVVSNGGCQLREDFFEKLSENRYVASGGKSKNNLLNKKSVVDKRKFLENYKFNIAFENSSTFGYTTEKIIQSWAAGCIPIYWGNPRIAEDFNKDAMICYSDFNSMNDLIEFLLALEDKKEKLEEILRTPIMTEDFFEEQKKLESFLVNIMSQKKEKAFRRRSHFIMESILTFIHIEE